MYILEAMASSIGFGVKNISELLTVIEILIEAICHVDVNSMP